jgi:predicted nucleotidyltransferase
MSTAVSSLAEQMLPILERYGVRKAGVFGSYARGDARPGSDLDLLVDLPPGSSLLDLVGLQLDLSEALGMEVDAGTYASIHPLVRERILRDEIRIL